MKRILAFIIPPPQWQTPVAILCGIFCGLGFYILYISNAVSYISDKPETCINCHIMNPQYSTWRHSSHHNYSNCNDCHVPHNNFVNKYYFKSKDGLRHSTMFTLRREPQVIRIKDAGISVVQENCKRCHTYMNKEVKTIKIDGTNYKQGEGKLCWDCHREVPHGTVNSLSATPYARVPKVRVEVPDWIKNVIGNKK